MGEMKIELLPHTKLLKKIRYKLTHEYKDIVKKEIDNMLKEDIIYPINQFEWASPMVFEPKKNDPKKLRVYVDFRWLNHVTLANHFHTPFVDKIVNKVERHDCYAHTHVFSRYNQVPIAKEDQHKTTFLCEFGRFSNILMPFSLNNAPTMFSRIVIKAFHKYMYKTMVVYFNE